MNIKAIETEYKGCLFRSRLEARWAVFFDALGMKWEYEKEGFEIGDGERYLPDFWLPEIGKGMWFEVKGEKPTDNEIDKLIKICEGSDRFGCIAWGTMDVPRIHRTDIAHNHTKIEIDGAIMLQVTPPSAVIKHHPNSKIDKEMQELSRSGICGFYEDPEGKFQFDRLYLNDIDFSKNNKTTENWSFYYMSCDVPVFYSDGVLEGGFIPVRTINNGCGRKYRSHKIIRAYGKARSARFEQFSRK